MKFWKTFKKTLIAERLRNVKNVPHRVTIWQSDISAARTQYTGRFIFNPLKESQIEILAESYASNPPINPEQPFYCHLMDQEIVFKRDKYHVSGRSIYFPRPNELKIYERRKNDRFYYKYQDHKDITLYSERVQESAEGPIGPAYKFSSVLVDISISGAGFVINQKQRELMKDNDIIFLTNLTDQELPTPFKTQVMYVSPYGDPKDKLFKIGLEFSYELDSISYRSITSIVEKKQTRVRGINPGRYCGLDEEDQERILNTIENQNSVLAENMRENIEMLDRLRYMTTQMKIEFLRDMNLDVLASALRLSSKELIYELLSEVTEAMQSEFLDKIEIERPASAVCKSQDQVVKFIRDKEAAGEYILDPKSFITYV